MDIANPKTQLALITALESVGVDGAFQRLWSAVEAILGGSVTVNEFLFDGPYPPWAIGWNQDTAVILSRGLWNKHQSLLAFAGGFVKPGGNVLFDAHARNMLYRLRRIPGMEYRHHVWVGHSYGGAAATIAAAIDWQDHTAGSVKVLTLGAPKPGNWELAGVMSRVPQVRLVNVGDLVPALPPDPREFPELEVLFPFVPWAKWGESIHTCMGTVQRVNGQRFESNKVSDTRASIGGTLAGWLQGTVTVAQDHLPGEYRRRCAIAAAVVDVIPSGGPTVPTELVPTEPVIPTWPAQEWPMAFIPVTFRPKVSRVDGVWWVSWRGRLICATPYKQSSVVTARRLYQWLLRLEKFPVCNVQNLLDSMSEYLIGAENPASGIVPTMNAPTT